MRLAIVSDAHLAQPDSARQRHFVAFLDGLRADRLVLSGDIFHTWAGTERSAPPSVAPACHAIARARERGMSVVFVLGNHELGGGPYLEDQLGLAVRPAHVDDSTGCALLLAHGDEGDSRVGYRLTRAALRGRAFAGGLRRLGPSRAHGLLLRLAGSAIAEDRRDAGLVARQRAWAARQLVGRARGVAMGHSHIAGLVDTRAGLIVHTGAWAGLRTWVSVRDGRLALMRWSPAGSDVLDARRWPPST